MMGESSYKEAYKHLELAIIKLEGYPDFESIRDDLIILKDKMGDMIW